MTISYSEICNRVYAASAIATLAPGSRAAFIHPDHERSVSLMVRDAVAAVIASMPRQYFTAVEYTPSEAVITLAPDVIDCPTVSAALMSAITSVVLATVKLAASDRPEKIVDLAAALPSITAGLAEYMSPAPRPAFIRPFP